MELLADSLSTQLENLCRERERLEQLLMLDSSWRALKQLEAREASGERLEADSRLDLKSSLVASLAANRIFAARAKLIETIELLTAETDAGVAREGPAPLSSRIVLLGTAGEPFRTRLRRKDPPPVAAPVAAPVAPAIQQPGPLPDALELIDGLARPAVEQLLEGHVTRFSDIANWTQTDVVTWRDRLQGVALGTPGDWIEQAALLATGARTRYAERARRGDFTALVAAPEPQPDPQPEARIEQVPLAAVDPAPERLPDLLPAVSAPASQELVADDEPHCVVGPEVAAGAIAVAALAEAAVTDASDADVADPAEAPEQRRLMTADELIRKLAAGAESAVPVQPAAREEADVDVAFAVSGPPPAAPRGAYARPEHRQDLSQDHQGEPVPEPASQRRYAGLSERMGSSDVVVITREAADKREGLGFTTGSRPRPQKLLRRLKQALEPDRFEAEGYAAYRGVVEEASVTIVRSDDPRPRPPTRPVRESAEVTRSNRFLKALTGRN